VVKWFTVLWPEERISCWPEVTLTMYPVAPWHSQHVLKRRTSFKLSNEFQSSKRLCQLTHIIFYSDYISFVNGLLSHSRRQWLLVYDWTQTPKPRTIRKCKAKNLSKPLIFRTPELNLTPRFCLVGVGILKNAYGNSLKNVSRQVGSGLTCLSCIYVELS
jgi:hypothetical protein